MCDQVWERLHNDFMEKPDINNKLFEDVFLGITLRVH